MRTITTQPGIGDAAWVLMKLINSGERFHFRIPDGSPQRGKQIYDMLPQLSESCTYWPGLTYRKVESASAHHFTGKWGKITENEFYLSANRHLEHGKRIEEFLPDLKTSFTLDYHTSDADKDLARTLLADGKYVGVYTSAYSNARHWNGWEAKEWCEMIRLLHEGDKEITFVIIGAKYDIGIPEEIMAFMDQQGIRYVNTIGQPLGVVVEMLKRLSYFIGFPSGLSILNETLGKDGVMFYAPHIKGIINAWPDPKRIEAGNYKGCLFCEPGKIYEWVRDEYKIYDRL